MDINDMPSVPICWVISTFNGQTENHFVLPEKKAELMLSLEIYGHTEIYEVFPGHRLSFLGTFAEGRAPF